MQGLFVAVSILLFASVALNAANAANAEYSICSAGDKQLLGSYKISESDTLDEAPVWTNGNDELSIFRNKGFWYIGNLGPWPPETHYRCVEAEGEYMIYDL